MRTASSASPGVGVVLDAGRTVTLAPGHRRPRTRPGFTAVIQAGDGVGGPFHDVSDPKTVGRRTTFDLNDAARAATSSSGSRISAATARAHVNEVTAG